MYTTTRKTYRVADKAEGQQFIRGYAAGLAGDFIEDLQQSLPEFDYLAEIFFLASGEFVYDVRLDKIEDAVEAWKNS